MMAAGIKAKAESDKNQQEIDKQRSKIEELKDTILLNRKKNKELNQKAMKEADLKKQALSEKAALDAYKTKLL